ncbi:MAG: hypothetical protein JXA72_07345 [Bacteroidales bacterium]|nr:hypothetical protein [Bacteroidales bacterium]
MKRKTVFFGLAVFIISLTITINAGFQKGSDTLFEIGAIVEADATAPEYENGRPMCTYQQGGQTKFCCYDPDGTDCGAAPCPGS